MNAMRQPAKGYAFIVRVALCCLLCIGTAWAQVPQGFEAAAQAFNQGNLAETERLSREALARHPDDPFGLNLLAVALDGQKKYAEAEATYLRALRGEHSAALLNNMANHCLAVGDKRKARQFFLKTLRLDPHHSNAHYQLAILDLDDGHAREALAHVRALSEKDRQAAAVVLLEGRALLESGQAEAARNALASLETFKDRDASVAFSLGVLYYREKLYSDAVRTFEAALRQSPGDFDILYNLGLAYYKEGEKQRSADVLERAVVINGRSVDALYHLGDVMAELGHDDAATELLIRAREIAPDRPELALLLAHECQKQQFWSDAAEAYEAYLRLKPEDWQVRRELALVDGRLRNFEGALSQMDRYLAARPGDAQGYYLRGLIAWHLKRYTPAGEDFRRALALDPRIAESWSYLGEIARERNDLPEAERCFRKALDIDPQEVTALYGLGQVFSNRGQYTEAVPFLKRALEVRPDEPAPHYQLAIAYRRLGEEEPARTEMDKFESLHRNSAQKRFLRTGLISYVQEGMNLSENQRQAHELEYLERAARIKPGDAPILTRLVDAYLASGNTPMAVETIRRWQESDPSGGASLRAGQLLSRHEQYETAVPYLREAAEHAAYLHDARVAQANAELHLAHYDSALRLLNQLTPPIDDPEYHLLRAATLDKLQRFDEALQAYRQAIREQPRQEGPYLELGLFFVNHLAYDAALENYRAAQKVLPRSLKLALAEAITLNLAGRREESYTKLGEIEGRWPEQDLPYILAGISAHTAYRFDVARAEFEKAAALDSSNPLAYYYLALLDSESPQSDLSEPLRWARMAVEGDSGFAPAHLLLGKLYRRQGKLQEARRSLEEAVRLQPNQADAHYLLGRTYAELGDSARAETETRESERWHREVHQVSPEKQSVLHLLVQVEPAR